MNEAVKKTWLTAPAIMFGVAAVLGPVFVLLLIKAANNHLPVEDAKLFKAPIFAIWAAVTSTGAIGVAVNSAMTRWAKLSTQRDAAKVETAQISPAAAFLGMADTSRSVEEYPAPPDVTVTDDEVETYIAQTVIEQELQGGVINADRTS